MKEKPKPIKPSEVIGWFIFMALVCMFAAIGIWVTIHEVFN